MTVHIRDFSVETESQSAAPEPTVTQSAQERPAQPLSGRKIAQMIKAARQRACRLHAD